MARLPHYSNDKQITNNKFIHNNDTANKKHRYVISEDTMFCRMMSYFIDC